MRRRKKSEPLLESGIAVNEAGDSASKQVLADLLVKGVLLFFIAYGTIGCFTTTFSIPYHIGTVAVTLLVTDLFLALIFYKNWVKNVGYILLFVIFLFGIFTYAKYVVSGFYGLANVCFERMGAAMNLSNVMNYTETVADRTAAITCFLIFYGVGLSTMLNSLISNYMSVGGVMFCTLPFSILGLYAGLMPNFFFALMLLGGFVMLYALRKSIHSSTGKSMLQFMGIAFLVTAVFLLLTNFLFPTQRIGKTKALSGVRAVSDEYVARFLSGGLMGMFNRYSGAGGMSGGHLGGTAIVTPDYETDLVVRMVPYTTDTLYLKGFVGTYYDGKRSQWITSGVGVDSELSKEERLSKINRESNMLARLAKKDKSVLKGKMEITNVGAAENYRYFPYYSIIEEGELCRVNAFEVAQGSSPLNQAYSVTFYPEQDKVMTSENASLDFVYYELPEENFEPIHRFCRAAGLSPGRTLADNVERMADYFQENYPYTKRPGVMPRKKDFVNYFLEENKTGYCAHFASAATLILRYLGYEARYIEGYCIPFGRVAEGEIVDEKVSDFLQGEPLKNFEKVADVKVDDSCAHAWTEVFVPEKGWMVVDVTPASTESLEDREAQNSFGFLSDLFGMGHKEQKELESIASDEMVGLDVGRYENFGRLCVVLLFVGGILLIIFYSKKRYAAYKIFHHENYAIALTGRYQYMCRKLCKRHPDFKEQPTHEMQFEWFEKHCDEDINEAKEILEKAAFSKDGITEAEYEKAVRVLKMIKKCK